MIWEVYDEICWLLLKPLHCNNYYCMYFVCANYLPMPLLLMNVKTLLVSSFAVEPYLTQNNK